MDDLDKLPSDLTFQPDGHLSDIALAAIADGEAKVVAENAIVHLERCDHCTTRLGAEALLTACAEEMMGAAHAHALAASPAIELNSNALKQVAKEEATPAPRAVLPKGALLAALVIATLGATPSLIEAALRMPETLRGVSRGLVLLIHSANLVVHSDAGTTLAWISSFLLLISGLVVSRLSRTRTANGLVEEGGF